MRGLGFTAGIAIAISSLVALAPAAAAQEQPYRANDYGGFRNILPPGQSHNATATEIGNNRINGSVPAQWDNQRNLYGDLVYAAPGLSDDRINNFFKDGSFGVPPGAGEPPYSPKPGITIVRDATYGVPHVYADSRANVMFGAGYVGAQDRLFFMDALRNAGRAKLSGFAGGSNKAMDIDVWENAPYTEEDLQRQYDVADETYGAEGAQLQQDVTSYVAGVNAYIAEIQLNPTLLPGEYTLLGQTLQPWKVTDVIATAALVGGIFGKGGGGELSNAEIYNAARARFGKVKGVKVWKDLRRQNDPEAPTTVFDRAFPYQQRKEEQVNPKAVAIPDRGSLIPGSPDDAPVRSVESRDLGQPSSEGLLGGLHNLDGGSNALLVSGAESESGHPLAVFGPQVSYYSPQILIEEELHAPDYDAAGTAFVGINFYVLLGRGQDYAWSATSAGQDITDTFAERLCEPGGGQPTVNSMHYLWKGECRPIEVLNRVNNITPNAADDSPAEMFDLQAQRTVHGVISERGTVDGKPVAFARLRSTYFHEADSAVGFSKFNTPSAIRSARDFQEAANGIGFTFNWFYADDRDIAYFNSGFHPIRAKGTDPEFPNWGTGKYDWRGWDASANVSDRASFDTHPQVINQSYLTSWNNKQAPGFSAPEDTYSFGSVHRSQSLDERIEAGIRGGSKLTLAGLINAMEDAGTVDLRGSQALPWMLQALGKRGVPSDLADEFATLSAWVRNGAHRRDADRNGAYDEARAVELMDAWWPRVLEGIFKPKLGDELFTELKGKLAFDNPPGSRGSAYLTGWYGYVEKDLRSLLGRKVDGAFSRSYCGSGGNVKKRQRSCKNVLAATLRDASTIPAATLYPRGDDCATGNAQVCNDAVRFQALGGIAVKEIHWINRPTWQQVVEVQGHRGRGTDLRCSIPRIGSNAGERLQGSAFPDRIVAKGGADTLYAEGGDDCMNGGAAGDQILAGGGIDRVKGGSGDDRIVTADGKRDTVSCGSGKDKVSADGRTARGRLRAAEAERRRGEGRGKRKAAGLARVDRFATAPVFVPQCSSAGTPPRSRRYHSASRAPLVPVPAAVTAWR